jgi:hypothetical protein
MENYLVTEERGERKEKKFRHTAMPRGDPTNRKLPAEI